MDTHIGLHRKTLTDFRWVPLEGMWEEEVDGIKFAGGEYDPPEGTLSGPANETQAVEYRRRFVNAGVALFGQPFQEGRIHMRLQFTSVDYRSCAGMVLQYNPETKDMLVFMITGGGFQPSPGVSGPLFRLQNWAPAPDQLRQQQGAIIDRPKVWTSLFDVGVGSNLKASRSYDLEVLVKGSMINIHSDGVEVGRFVLPSSLAGFPCGAFSLSSGDVRFSDIYIEASQPKAFVAMQFNTAEFEALYREVIEPVCRQEGLLAYRADLTYMPGLIIEDIKKQIAESRIIIAEITPQNANVYYEVGYADALNKPIILVSDRKEGMKPFDVRAYRTIFYDNSIGGKIQIENDLRAYLRNIMEV